METWAIVTLVLGASAISALLTFLITKMQVRHSDKRLEKELQRQRKAESQQRRWVVRSEPLLRLRAEVAIMAAKQHKLVAFVYRYRQHARIGISEEVAKKELQETADECSDYLRSGEFAQALFMQFDAEPKNKAREILDNSQKTLISAMDYASEEALEDSLNLIEGNTARITEVQELVNERLEKL